MRITKVFVLALLAACGGSQDTSSDQTQLTGEEPVDDTPPVEETPPVEDTKPVEVKPTPPPEPPKLTAEEKIAFGKACFAAWLKEDPGQTARCYADDAVMTHVDGMRGPQKGHAAIAADSKMFTDSFTIDGELVTVLVAGNNVFNVGLLTGVNDGPMMGMPATNKKFGQFFAEAAVVDDWGRVKEVRLYYDPGTMMAQLGMAKIPARKAMAKTGAETVVAIASDSETENQNVELVRGGFDIFAKHDAKALAALYTDKAVFSEQAMPADVKGKKKIEANLKELFTAFPDASEAINNIWGAGDYVVVETTFTGTNTGKAPGMGLKKPTGKAVKASAAHLFKIEGGKVSHHWVFPNGMAWAMQLGLMPPPGAPAAKPEK